jgi:molecular chaperone GrpE
MYHSNRGTAVYAGAAVVVCCFFISTALAFTTPQFAATGGVASFTTAGRHNSDVTSFAKRILHQHRLIVLSSSTSDDSSSSQQQKDPTKEQKQDTDILNSPAFLKRKLQVLKTDVSKADEKIAKAKADIEAGKEKWGDKLKELEREKTTVQERLRDMYQNEDKLASTEVAKAMLDVLDNFDRAFKNLVPETPTQKEVEASYTNTYDMITKAFLDLGIKQIETVGKEFDYLVHSAVMTSPSDEYDEGIVIQELQKGYALDDEVIRAAYVVVAS